jgi:hypothetical protein
VLGIVSFVGCPVVAAVAAIITGSRAKQAVDRSGGRRSGRGMAVAGQILGWANLALSLLLGALIGVLVAVASSHSSYTSLNAGDCFNPVGSGIFASLVTKQPCSQPHVDEAVGSFDLTASSWPGATGVRAEAEPECSVLATQYIGQSSTTGLQLVWIYPNRATFNSGTRKVVCAVRNADGTKRTGSVRSGLGATTSG